MQARARVRFRPETHRNRVTQISRRGGHASAQVPRWTAYGVGDGVDEAASVAGDGVGAAVVSTVEGGAAGAGYTAPLNIFDLPCFWLCNCSGACCL